MPTKTVAQVTEMMVLPFTKMENRFEDIAEFCFEHIK